MSWHCGLRWGTDVRASAFSGEADRCAEGILHPHRGGGYPANSRHQLYGGQHTWGCGIERDQVEHVLTRCLVTERYLGNVG